VTTLDEVLEQNRILRERLERLETAQPGLIDPLLHTIVEHAPAFLTAITPDGRLVATGRTSEAFGSVIGRSVFEFTEPAEHTLMRRAYARVCETKQPLIYESTGQGENGEPNHTYIVRAVPVIEHDTVKTIVLIPTDITDRVRLERALEHSEAKLRFAVAATRMGLWSWDLERDAVTWDERVLEIFGVSEPPADQRQYLALIHPEDRPLVVSALEQATRTGVYASFEHRLAQPMNGVERWVLGTGTVLKNPGGQATGLMGGALDITAQKSVAAQLQRAQRVEALGQLTAGLAHNFNNLLGAIIPNIELGLQHPASEDRAPLKAALDASLQARDLVKKLTSLTRQRPTEAAKWSDPREVLERAAAICRATFPREIQLTLTLPPKTRHVSIDASDLDQVVLNLLLNARDAFEQSQGRSRLIEVMLDDVSGPRHVRLRVRDNGAGMSTAVQARIFEPFFTTKPTHRGSGLGLADAVLRLQDADGTIECHSAVGEGTTFTVLLPEAPAPIARPARAAAQPIASNGETILIVDDEAGVRTAIGRLLTQKGYEVLEAESAEQARATLTVRGAAVSLILLDQSMPNESGPEALPSLKRLTDAPIVLFTGGVGDVPPGIAGLLEKPALAADLLKLVHDLIDRSSSGPR
jgi:two-component system cell cycle sensor histidine kinase/response regulator CckA